MCYRSRTWRINGLGVYSIIPVALEVCGDSTVFSISEFFFKVLVTNNSNILDNRGCNVPECQTISFEFLP